MSYDKSKVLRDESMQNSCHTYTARLSGRKLAMAPTVLSSSEFYTYPALSVTKGRARVDRTERTDWFDRIARHER
jgi:hypothetical protein